MPWNGSTWVPHEVAGGNASTFTDLIQYANDVSGNVFGVMLLVSVFLVIFIASSSKNQEAALPASLFITTILSYIMAAMDAVGDWVAWVMTFVLMGSVILLYKGGSSNV